jgi:hypothetical protein
MIINIIEKQYNIDICANIMSLEDTCKYNYGYMFRDSIFELRVFYPQICISFVITKCNKTPTTECIVGGIRLKNAKKTHLINNKMGGYCINVISMVHKTPQKYFPTDKPYFRFLANKKLESQIDNMDCFYRTISLYMKKFIIFQDGKINRGCEEKDIEYYISAVKMYIEGGEYKLAFEEPVPGYYSGCGVITGNIQPKMLVNYYKYNLNYFKTQKHGFIDDNGEDHAEISFWNESLCVFYIHIYFEPENQDGGKIKYRVQRDFLAKAKSSVTELVNETTDSGNTYIKINTMGHKLLDLIKQDGYSFLQQEKYKTNLKTLVAFLNKCVRENTGIDDVYAWNNQAITERNDYNPEIPITWTFAGNMNYVSEERDYILQYTNDLSQTIEKKYQWFSNNISTLYPKYKRWLVEEQKKIDLLLDPEMFPELNEQHTQQNNSAFVKKITGPMNISSLDPIRSLELVSQSDLARLIKRWEEIIGNVVNIYNGFLGVLEAEMNKTSADLKMLSATLTKILNKIRKITDNPKIINQIKSIGI